MGNFEEVYDIKGLSRTITNTSCGNETDSFKKM